MVAGSGMDACMMLMPKPQTAQQHTHRRKNHKPNTNSRSSAQGLIAGFCEHSNEISGFIKVGAFD
jgi:hypothetical protein